MRASSNTELTAFSAPRAAAERDALRDDPKWTLAQSVAAGPHFARSALLSKFLLYVVGETLEGRHNAISEHKIGVIVFGRPPHYRTDEDNIVRNYARQLRRRLADHFAVEGKNAPMRIEIPVGGYIPSFHAVSLEPRFDGERLEEGPSDASRHTDKQIFKLPAGATGWHSRTLLILLIALAALGAAWAAVYRYLVQPRIQDSMHVFWRNVMPASRATCIVPADAGLNLIEDFSQRAVPLADYIKGTYETMPFSLAGRHASQDLHTQQYTDYVSLETISRVAQRPEFDPQRVQPRFPRDLRLNDLKTGNAIIIGSSSSNPWASVVDAGTNFGIVTRPDMEGAQIVNRSPASGERPVYTSNWNEPAHETFALILYQPNLSRTGNTLLIEGLDVAGTQGAAEVLFGSDVIAPVVRQAERPDGTLRNFEILLRTTSIQSSAEGTQILASRIE